MTTFTDKELIKEIKERIGSLDVRDNIERRAYEIALASLEAEPVVYMWDSERKDIDAPGYYRTEHLVFAESSVKQWGGRVVPLYTAQPVPVTPDGWISCSERMPDSKTAVLVAREFDRKGDWRMKWATYIPGHPDANDGWIIPGASWKPSHWMPLPEPPQEVNRG
ncbi:DUF551 domain-containing protein [Escherichia coli]|nr:DUF551 domain-containing protein [Escherichia coli]EIF8881212.1 DUF551 domain-containing protein [Salmonella enterica]EFC4842616.1 DUF551 domain-containing protein [Escherichia coli]EGK3983584.1 DUF551 domain-containing protein [Escherichia coli]EHK7244878.1 DUF551 domain-containing protein [Escherichia coli]